MAKKDTTERTFTLEGYRFMRDHAGYSYRPSIETEGQGRVRSALEMARAEYVLRRSAAEVVWEDDADGTATGEHPAWSAMLLADCDIKASLWGIDAAPGDPYRRVVAAELALEAGICHPLDRRFIPKARS